MILSGGISTNSKSKISCADSNLRPRCEASDTSKGLPRLRPRDEARKSEIREWGREEWYRRAMVAHFGAYVNHERNFSIKKCVCVREGNGLRTNQVNAQLRTF
ncbi:hypothetical protein AVEN_222779-1 [Araneus ventricosus]|uniref:Uncharacterized protein n=1 Tax=Araneus ventricosus TaxID=182803 RepID=A0A4Y2B1W1_ARAVE|nr:hypothetical protein AVEN_222779-1 [Araneus ventricosus]